jgi:hypothetical protein
MVSIYVYAVYVYDVFGLLNVARFQVVTEEARLNLCGRIYVEGGEIFGSRRSTASKSLSNQSLLSVHL